MKPTERSALLWIAVLVAAAAAVTWLYPRVFPLAPRSWTVSREEAREIALERLRDLGEVPADAYVVVRMADDARLEYRLLEGLRAGRGAAVRASRLPERVLVWEVTVYPPGARPNDWTLQGELGLDGRVLSLRRGFPAGEAGGTLAEADAVARAGSFLAEQGSDLRRYEAPQVRRKDLEKRTDLAVRFGEREPALGDRLRYGLEVSFAGDRLGGYSFFLDDPGEGELTQALQPLGLFGQITFFSTFLLLPFVAPVFLRRYHLGEIGVRRGLEIFALCVVLGVLFFAQVAAGATQGADWGVLSRRQLTWVWAGQLIVVFVGPLALAAGLSWSAGESYCRERWGRKLAAFDALFQGQWGNRTVAAAALRGYAAGWGIAALTLALAAAASRGGSFALFSLQMGPFWNHGRFPGVALVLFLVLFGLYSTLFGRLFLLSALVHRVGRWAGGAIATLATAFVFFAPVLLLPLKAGVPIWIVYSAATVVLFLATDLLTTLLAGVSGAAVLCAFPLALAASPSVQVQGWLALLAGALPLALSARHLVSDREFTYRYEDVPPHVRRIAERERHRVELETARNIQSSILPELPDAIHGVELAHVYLPATEVGGDFYDVLTLPGGRLALAVGDVAGHGVGSGLVMAMARSALAVQVAYDPEVGAVFETLNRLVHGSARRRLLTTLCYALLDPARRRLTFASAGHLFPYRVGAGGRVEILESVAYPLGVRPRLEVAPRSVELAAGDLVFLCSDGLVEARPEGSEEHFGFERLERLLAETAGLAPREVCRKVVAALEAFAGDSPREDDLTLLAVRVP